MEMHLDNCPFCGKDCVFNEEDPGAYKCGCRTEYCRGNIKDSRFYYSFEVMWKIWNRRPNK